MRRDPGQLERSSVSAGAGAWSRWRWWRLFPEVLADGDEVGQVCAGWVGGAPRWQFSTKGRKPLAVDFAADLNGARHAALWNIDERCGRLFAHLRGQWLRLIATASAATP